MRRVAISQRVERHADRQEVRDALDEALVRFVGAAGGLAIPVPNTLHEEGLLDVWLDSVRPEALVLSGGNDIGSEPARDATERRLLDRAIAAGWPVLGICRGMQMMAVHAGARLVAVDGHVRTRHALVGRIRGEVNSFHAFAVGACPEGFVPLAVDATGRLEAIGHLSRPMMGWMWHPERETPFDARDVDLLLRLWRPAAGAETP